MPVAIAADVTDCNSRFLGRLLGSLRQLLSPLLTQRRHLKPNELSVVLRVDPDVGLQDGLLDIPQRTRIEWLDDKEVRLGRGDIGDLLERRRAPIVVNTNPVHEPDVRPPRAHPPVLFLQDL